MKIRMTFLALFFTSLLLGQELSLAIPITTDMRTDAGIQIEKLDEGYLILGGTFCNDSLPFEKCLGLLKTDKDGNPIWATNYDGSPHGSLRPNGRTMVVHDDTIYVANMIWKNDHDEIRMMSFDMEGNLLEESDFFIPYQNTFFLRGMIGTEEKLVVFSEVKQNGQHRVLIQDFDFELNLLGEYHFGISNFNKIDVVLKQTEDKAGFLLAYGEHNGLFQSVMHLNKLDAQYNITYSKQLPEPGSTLSATDFIETEDNGYMLAWNADVWDDVIADTFPYPTIVYGLDSLFDVEWEHIFLHRSAKEHISTIKTQDGNMLGIGITDYTRVLWIYPDRQGGDGWCFLLSPEGDLLWERVILDTMDIGFGRFWHGVETDQGFTLVGDIDMPNPTGVPFLNDPEVWLLTLDKNGCWNGNCEEVIVITGDSTSFTGTHDMPQDKLEMKVYPNPTMGLLTIESGQGAVAQKRSAMVFGITGKLVASFDLTAPKSTINLRDLENGIYIVTQMEDGLPVSSQKIIVHH